MPTIRERKGAKGSRYQAIVRIGGHPPERATFRTKGEAKAWAIKTEAAIIDGKHFPSREAKKRTVRDLLDRYKKSEIPKKKDQLNPVRYADFWIERLGDRKLHQLTRATVVEVRDELEKDKSPGTVNRYLALLSHACSVAEREWEWMESNPLRKVSRLTEPTGRVRYLSNSERDGLLKSARSSDLEALYPIVLIALTTGARRSEIMNLRWKDIDLKSGRAVLEKTKNSERRTLTLVGPVVVELKKLSKVRSLNSDGVFQLDTAHQFNVAWKAALAQAKVTDFRFHDLRHSCASYLAMNGATTAEIAAVLGHKTLAMVKRYSHLSDEHVRGVVEKTALKVLGDA